METPYLTHITSDDYKYVYEPSEDSFLLLDALEADLTDLISNQPTLCLEIGSGSGVIITATAKVLKNTACFAIDINPYACSVTKRTAVENDANVEVVNMNLLNGFLKHSIDLLIFNPPYVVTPDNEVHSNKNLNDPIIQSWAGGKDGRIVMDKIFDKMDEILSSLGIAYILVIEENKPQEILTLMKKKGFIGSIVLNRRIRGENLFVLRFHRKA